MKKIVTIIRGVSGSGKSTFGEALKALNPHNTQICCADDYFTDDEGNYNFEVTKLHIAHKICFNDFKSFVANDTPHIIVNNTSTKENEFKKYKEFAETDGYKVFVVVMENWHGGANIHDVPEIVLEKQEVNIKNSLKIR